MYSDKSLPILERTFKEVDIYAFNNFPYQILAHDSGYKFPDILNDIRVKWLYGQEGFVSNILKYSSLLKRSLEFLVNFDYPNSLRQKTNIVSEMIECDFRSYVPIHTSIVLKSLHKKVVLNAKYPKTGNEFNMITHPGQTRVQAGVFCRRNLDNVLLYVPKSQAHLIEFKNFDQITKIKSPDQLYRFYAPEGYNKKHKYKVDLSFGDDSFDVFNDQKVHLHSGMAVPILKATHIHKDVSIINSPIDIHPSTEYVVKSFDTFNKLCSIFFNNQFKVYTKLKVKRVNEALLTNQSKLYSLNSNNKTITGKHLYNIMEYSQGTAIKSNINFDISKYLDEDLKDNYRKLFNFFDPDSPIIKHELANQLDISQFRLQNLPVISINTDTELSEVVKLNEYKGFTVMIGDIQLDRFFRDIYELLYFIPPNYTVTKSTCGELAIINCEHEYWKTGKNYKEYKLKESMYYV